MHLSRRNLLAGFAGTFALGMGAPWAVAAVEGGQVRYLTCAKDSGTGNKLVGIDGRGVAVFEVPIPARGHGLAVSPDQRIGVAFGRRPGMFAAVADIRAGKLIRMIEPSPDRPLYGHGAFSADNKLLYVTELKSESGDGQIGVFDVADGYKRVGEFGVGGLGPHEVRLAPDGKTLVVAVSGVLTGLRTDKVNIPIMKSRLVYIEAATGSILESAAAPAKWHKLAIRHMDIAPDGRVAVAMQYQGDPGESVPLIALHRRGGAMVYLRAPLLQERKLDQYIGSIAFDATGDLVGATSPRGDAILVWDSRRNNYLGGATAADAAGIAPVAGGGFIATGGNGGVWGVNATIDAPRRNAERHWDNHLIPRVRA